MIKRTMTKRKIFVKQLHRTWADNKTRYAVSKMINILPKDGLQIGCVIAEEDLWYFMNVKSWEVEIT